MVKLAIWAAIISATSWLLNSILVDPKLVEIAQDFNTYAAAFALLSAVALLLFEHRKDYKKSQEDKSAQEDDSFERIISGNPSSRAEFKAVDNITKPEK